MAGIMSMVSRVARGATSGRGTGARRRAGGRSTGTGAGMAGTTGGRRGGGIEGVARKALRRAR